MSERFLSVAGDEPVRFADDTRIGEFARMSGGLTTWMTASETVFLEAGERLHAAHGRITRVRDGITRATEIFTGPVMSEVSGRLGAAAEDIRTAGRLAGERSRCLSDLHATLDEATVSCSALKTVFRTLDYVVLIARTQVESMRDGHADLIPFAHAVDDLVTSGANVAHSMDERMSALGASLAVSRAIAAQGGALDGEPEVLQGFLSLIELIETQERDVAARREEAHAAFTAVWRAVAAAVMGLQSHDMARQRLEHTVRNLAIMEEVGRNGIFDESEEPVPSPLRAAAMRRVARLEIAQLADLAATYGALMTKLGEDLAGIADRLDACGGVLERLRPADVGVDDGLAALEAEAERLRVGIRAGDGMRRRIGESLEHTVSETVSLIDMTNKMAELEFQLNLAGLNAAIRAAHVKGGDETIGYIARVIREQALRARQEADKLRFGIERAVAATEELTGEVLPALAGAETSIDENLTRAAARLSAAETESREALDGSALASASLGGEVRAILGLVDVHGEGRKMMSALAAALEFLVSDMPPEELDPARAEQLDAALSAVYTMKEERDVFARVFGRTPEVANGAPDGDETVDDLDDILF